MKHTIIEEGQKGYKRCKRCICDTTVPGISFDNDEICNYCALQDKMEAEYPNDERGKKILLKAAEKIKREGKNKKYDCIAGISGGRDSTYTLHYLTKVLGLRPLAVHFNDGFGNPIAGENMIKVTQKLGIELRTITSDWRESKDIKLAFLKSSSIDMEEASDIGIATALYGTACKENIKHIIIGQSFRTEGICPLPWNYLDGDYLRKLHKKYGTVKLRKWTPSDPGFNLGLKEMFFYAVIKRIKTLNVLYYTDYVRKEVDELIETEFDWKSPGAHYFDDLYQAVLTYAHRVKYKANRRIYNYSALVRSGQMDREKALEKSQAKYSIEDPKIIDLCIKRLGITREEFDKYIAQPPKYFYDFPNNYRLIMLCKLPIWILAKLDLIPGSAYDKYFNCGKY